jgi:catechol 2,3-dioxygenase-like lactoylglutathione lyase family enzyme
MNTWKSALRLWERGTTCVCPVRLLTAPKSTCVRLVPGVFLTPPVDWGGEIRCFFRDPDGHLLEISQVT